MNIFIYLDYYGQKFSFLAISPVESGITDLSLFDSFLTK